MQKKLIVINVFVVTLLQIVYAQHPQLKMWSLPDHYYEFPTSLYTPINQFPNLPTTTHATRFHNIMYANNNVPYNNSNKLWFYNVDYNIYDANGNIIYTFSTSPSSNGMFTGEICMVPVPDQLNQYYVITPKEYVKLKLCNEIIVTNGIDLPLPEAPSSDSKFCEARYFFLATTKEFIKNGTKMRYLFRFTGNYDGYPCVLDVFKITEDDIVLFQSFDENPYFHVGMQLGAGSILEKTAPPKNFAYVSEMEVMNKYIEGSNLNIFRLVLPFMSDQEPTPPNTTMVEIPGIKVFEFDDNLNILDNKEYIFHQFDNIDDIDQHKINGLELTPNGRFLFFNISRKNCEQGDPQNRSLVYIDLNDFGNLPVPNTNPNSITLNKMPVPPSTSYYTDFANSFIEWGYDEKLYYANQNNLLVLNYQNIKNYDYNPSFIIPSTDWNVIPLNFSNDLCWNFQFDCEQEYYCNAVYVLPDQIDGENYDNTLGCCMTAPNLPTTCCVGENFDATQFFTDWSFETATYNYGDGTEITLYEELPSPHLYSEAGDYTLTVTLYWPCGTKTVTGYVHVSCCTSPFTFSDAIICLGDNYTPDFLFSDPNAPVIPFNYTVSYGDNSYDLSLQPGTTFPTTTHQYSQPGIYTVTITLTWGTGCSITETHNVTVTGGSLPALLYPLHTVCLYIPNSCYPWWEGPSNPISGSDFNASHYELTIWDNSSNIQIYYNEDDVIPPVTSFGSLDINWFAPPNIFCKIYRYKLVLSNCSNTKTDSGTIYVDACEVNGSSCYQYSCSTYNKRTDPGNNKIDSNDLYDIRVYPNPSNGKVFIFVPQNLNEPIEYVIEVCNMLNEPIIKTKAIKQDFYTLDLSNFNNGEFLIKIITKKKIYIRKIIKN